VGVYRSDDCRGLEPTGFPHARGGVPQKASLRKRSNLVFPTHVGVYLAGRNFLRPMIAFSPRTWGCTVETREENLQEQVFPTHVGVYRRKNPD